MQMMGWNESGFCSLSDFCSFGKFINSLMESAPGREPMEMFELMNWREAGKGFR